MGTKDWFEYMKVFEETIEAFGIEMDREMLFGEYVDACRRAGLPMDDEPEMPEDFMKPYHL